jgi:hypothetical protein
MFDFTFAGERAMRSEGASYLLERLFLAMQAALARWIYNERYVALPMNHQVKTGKSDVSAEYSWRSDRGWNCLSIIAEGSSPELPRLASEEQFISEHCWGYTKQRDGGTVEYKVAHPCWKVWSGCVASFEGDVTELYGQELASVLAGTPSSAFLAEGSAVTVFRGQRI